MKFLLGVVGGGVLIAAGFLYTGGKWSPVESYAEIFEEITSLEVAVRHLTPDNTGLQLAYSRSTDPGLRLVVVDLETLERTEVHTEDDVTQVFDWSADDRYIAFLERTAPPRQIWVSVWDRDTGEVTRVANDVRRVYGWSGDGHLVFSQRRANEEGSWIYVWDSRDGGVRRFTEDEDVTESSFTWLSGETFFFVSNPDRGREQTFWGNIAEETLTRSTIYIRADDFIPVADNRATFVFNNNFYGFEVAPETGDESAPTPRITPISSFEDDAFDSFRWLRYNREVGQYLFCARPKDSTWRYLYRYDLANDRLEQLSHEDTYNGQFLQQGRGFAYVGNPDNRFYLAVRPEDPAEHVDLFTEGSVVSYRASPDGERLYVHAAIGDEPHGIWEYDLGTRQLRQISGVIQKPFVASRIIEPEELRIASFDGKEIPAFFFTPPAAPDAEAERSGLFTRRKKYPAVIYIPPNSAQMQRSYGPRSQFLANIGFYFLAVNYRGVDGYGRDYAESYHPPTAAKDILAAYEWLIQNPNVDRRNIFIFSMSGGTPICMELLATAPRLWRGMAIDKPGGMFVDPRLNPHRLPSLFLITGDQDPAMASVKRFEEWAKENRVDVQLEVYEDADHITFDLASRKRSQDEVARFYIRKVR